MDGSGMITFAKNTPQESQRVDLAYLARAISQCPRCGLPAESISSGFFTHITPACSHFELKCRHGHEWRWVRPTAESESQATESRQALIDRLRPLIEQERAEIDRLLGWADE